MILSTCTTFIGIDIIGIIFSYKHHIGNTLDSNDNTLESNDDNLESNVNTQESNDNTLDNNDNDGGETP